MIRSIAWLCLALGFIVAAWAAYQVIVRPDVVPELLVDQPRRNLGEQPVGRHPLTFRLTNSTNRLLHVTIPRGNCGTTCCLISERDEQLLTLGALESIDISWELDIRQPGTFFTSIQLLVCGKRMEAVTLTVEGVGIAREDSSNGHAQP